MNGNHSRRPEDLPRIPGHEAVGTVVEVGAAVTTLSAGQRVMSYFYLFCDDCDLCRLAHEPLCRRLRGQVGVAADGGYAEYLALPARNFLPVPEGVSVVDATAIPDAIATPFHVSRRAAIVPGDTVLVVGAAGGVGIHMVQMAREFGGAVIAIDRGTHKLKAVSEFGALAALDADTPDLSDCVRAVAPGGVAVAIDLVGMAQTLGACLEALGPRGRLVLLTTFPGGVTEGAPRRMVQAESSIIGPRAGPTPRHGGVLPRLQPEQAQPGPRSQAGRRTRRAAPARGDRRRHPAQLPARTSGEARPRVRGVPRRQPPARLLRDLRLSRARPLRRQARVRRRHPGGRGARVAPGPARGRAALHTDDRRRQDELARRALRGAVGAVPPRADWRGAGHRGADVRDRGRLCHGGAPLRRDVRPTARDRRLQADPQSLAAPVPHAGRLSGRRPLYRRGLAGVLRGRRAAGSPRRSALHDAGIAPRQHRGAVRGAEQDRRYPELGRVARRARSRGCPGDDRQHARDAPHRPAARGDRLLADRRPSERGDAAFARDPDDVQPDTRRDPPPPAATRRAQPRGAPRSGIRRGGG